MFDFLNKSYFRLQILGLMLLKPAILFDRINQLSWYKKTHRQWFDDLRLTKKSKVLEVACATGTLTNYINASDFIPTGLDSSKKMIDLAKRKYSAIDFIEASALEIPFEDEMFDSVIAASLLNIIPDKQLLLSELFRTCKQGGLISVLVPCKYFDDKALSLLEKHESATGFSSAAMLAWHSKPPKMSAKEITCLLEQAGFNQMKSKFYLRGMVIAVNAKKPMKAIIQEISNSNV